MSKEMFPSYPSCIGSNSGSIASFLASQISLLLWVITIVTYTDHYSTMSYPVCQYLHQSSRAFTAIFYQLEMIALHSNGKDLTVEDLAPCTIVAMKKLFFLSGGQR